VPSKLRETLLSGVNQLASQTPVCVPRVTPVAVEPVQPVQPVITGHEHHHDKGKHRGKHHGNDEGD